MSVRFGESSKKAWRIILIGFIILIAVAGGMLFVFRDRIFYSGPKPAANSYAPTREMLEAASEQGYRPDLLRMRLNALLIDDSQTGPYVLSWYLLPGQLLSMTPAQSAYIDLTDQALLMRLYVARKDRSSAAKLSAAIAQDFDDGNGGFFGARRIDQIDRLSGKAPTADIAAEHEPTDRNPGTSLEAECAYLRALLEYHARWGKAEDWERIRNAALSVQSEDGTLLQDYAFVPTDTSEWPVAIINLDVYLEERDEPVEMYRAMKLCAPDLRAFLLLAQTDAQYEPLYNDALEILRGGYISDRLPLFALAYSTDNEDYIYTAGGDAKVDAISSIKTMLRLSEVGALPVQSLAWIREQIYNSGFIYTEYDIITGAAASPTEATEAYGLILLIAISEGDENLYARTLDRLRRSMATLETSPARYMIFRKVGDYRNMTTATDNLTVLLAMTGDG